MDQYFGTFKNGTFGEGHGAVLTSINPATDEVVWEAKTADQSDVDGAMQSARVAFKDWSQLSVDERQKYLTKFAEVLTLKKDDFALTISRETGKPLWESKEEVGAMIRKIQITFNAYQERCQHVHKEMGDAERFTRFKPHGVVGVLGPFNLPGHLPNGHIVPALLAGNTIVFKPSEKTPRAGQEYGECLKESGLPNGVFNMVQGDRKTGAALSEHQDLDGLFFTGSANTGLKIHQAFGGKPEKILALEMGGNNPLVIGSVSDITAACYLTIQSAFITSGQRCVCARRLIIVKNAQSEKFLDLLIHVTENIKSGVYSDDPEPFMGPVISKEAADHCLQWQDKLINAGGFPLLKLQCKDNKALLSPGIIDMTDVKQKEDIEIFGPLLQVILVNDLDEAIEEANQTQFGLAAGIFCDEKKDYEKFYRLSRAGVVNWNRATTGASSEAPFGGIGISGNHQPSAYFAADYCSYPVASVESNELALPGKLYPGVSI